MNTEQINRAAELWASGMKASDIADAVGATLKQFEGIRFKMREAFPFRSDKDRRQSERLIHQPRAPVRNRKNVMRWKTASGATVSLPRVYGIECPRRGS